MIYTLRELLYRLHYGSYQCYRESRVCFQILLKKKVYYMICHFVCIFTYARCF